MRKKIGSSKRLKCSMKYKVKKRAAEHRRKVKKESRNAKENKVVSRESSKFTKIPNMYPHKKAIIQSKYFRKEEGSNNIS
mmetsp:Transcript_5686/g.5863  ORF Transcript_5686/g.5863 Transcript_5686/m.5863 type:complete len:80 (+) Transcript_5686:22-261(+)